MQPCGALTTLIQASKKASGLVVKAKGFALPKAGSPEGTCHALPALMTGVFEFPVTVIFERVLILRCHGRLTLSRSGLPSFLEEMASRKSDGDRVTRHRKNNAA